MHFHFEFQYGKISIIRKNIGEDEFTSSLNADSASNAQQTEQVAE